MRSMSKVINIKTGKATTTIPNIKVLETWRARCQQKTLSGNYCRLPPEMNLELEAQDGKKKTFTICYVHYKYLLRHRHSLRWEWPSEHINGEY